ncbi:MAG: HAD family phosphatase [Chloroflexi bacterium]|nr:MAG: HAD-superfamily hydrolase, subfamily IA, variant 3 [Chloroflexi bacterium OLB13]MBV6437338.1 Hexitol phosphatase B [Anaerolineae bacterium]MCC6565387.1 HAD family phosphatase [Chloroflexota bacterium]MDL1915562.1 HAD family phosphatase [Anaerolineae bacterium CFX4]MBW7878077.1 HAD family phosphatase [Anaerolineae bacterium]
MPKRLTGFAGVIFDMDGLLVDSETVWHIVEAEFFADRGVTYTDADRQLVIGLRIDHFLDLLRTHYGLTEPLEHMVADLNARMEARIPKMVKEKPGAHRLIDFLLTHDIPMGVASNSSAGIIDVTMRAMGWDDVLRVRCTGDDEQAGKPAPDVYLTAARRLGIQAARSLGLEDSRNGARAVVAAGMTCGVVPDVTYTQAEAFREITPHIFGSLDDVRAWLEEELS